MTTATHEDVRRRTGDLAQKIITSLWQHDDALSRPFRRSHDGTMSPLDTSLKAPVVTAAAEVKVDDVVVIFDQRRRVHRFDLLRHFTAREAVADSETVVARVTATTASMITVAEFPLPTGYWSSCDLTAFGEPKDGAQRRTMRAGVAGRQIGRLGALDDLRRRIAAHADFSNWQTGYAASGHAQQAAEEERHARNRAEQERQAPLRVAAERLQQLVGDDLVHWGGPWVASAVVAKPLREPGRLRTYIAGLRCTEAINAEEYSVAREQLDLLGL
ncbi:hypothetical protein [Streptomyces niveus]|uniref:hypothetical protein n=1 Tax=Streptomyces niveus TaxID=193462 RepID=UPI00342E2EDC